MEENDWKKYFGFWQNQMQDWATNALGLDKKNIHELDVPKDELAHYSKRTIDFEYDFPFGKKELYGLAYRTDFDLKNHYKEPPYENFYPHVIEPSFGVDRSVLAVLCDAYSEENDPEKNGAGRIILKLKPSLAPYKVAVSCLKKNDEKLVKKAKEIYQDLKKDFSCDFDNRGNPGKFYGSQDEIGTPFCIMIDFQTLEDNTITIRNRDTMNQERIAVKDLTSYLKDAII
jgi:glycyl-tRNA synthetase